MKTSERGIKLITEFEGFRSEAYLDVVGVPTIGYGFTENVKLGDTITRAEAAERLRKELAKYEKGVLDACTIQPNQNELDAFVCFAFNVGVGGFRKSSVLRSHNRGDKQAAARAFALWANAGGKVFPGLVRRRAAEAALYLEPCAQGLEATPVLDMPQMVDEERPMGASNINRASLVAGSTAAVATATEVVNTVNGFKYGLESLGDWLVPGLLVVVVALCGYIIWERFDMRRKGIA